MTTSESSSESEARSAEPYNLYSYFTSFQQYFSFKYVLSLHLPNCLHPAAGISLRVALSNFMIIT